MRGMGQAQNWQFNSESTTSSFTVPSLKEVGSLEDSSSGWSWQSESISISKNDSFSRFGLVEQTNTTAYKSDHLWYSLSIDKEDDAGAQVVLHTESLGHALHAFINGNHARSGTRNSGNAKAKLDIPITLVTGKNKIDLLSLTGGFQHYGVVFDTWDARITGPVMKGLNNGSTIDLSSQQWTYQAGLKGEDLDLTSGNVRDWNSQSSLPKNQPLTWYETNLAAPSYVSESWDPGNHSFIANVYSFYFKIWDPGRILVHLEDKVNLQAEGIVTYPENENELGEEADEREKTKERKSKLCPYITREGPK